MSRASHLHCNGSSRKPTSVSSIRRRRVPEVDALEEGLRQVLGTRVRVVGSLTRGRIELPYASASDLERLHARLVTGPRERPETWSDPSPRVDSSRS